MKAGVVLVPQDVPTTVSLAQGAEAAGFWAVGIADSTLNFGDTYVTAAAVLAATERIRVGPCVTNPVTRHWSVHAAALRSLDQIGPGRTFLGLGVGDSAVHSYGLQPATGDALEDAVARIRRAAGTDMPVHVAASGPRRARTAGRVADAVMIATGMDIGAYRSLSGEVEHGRREAGVDRAVERWSVLVTGIGESDADVAALRRELRPVVVASAHFSFAATYDGKNVPEVLRGPLEQGFTRYDFTHHGVAREGSPLGAVFEADPETADVVHDYLYDRFAVIGTPAAFTDRLRAWGKRSQVDGVWFSALLSDPETLLVRSADVLEELR